jgi:hypothetical protein
VQCQLGRLSGFIDAQGIASQRVGRKPELARGRACCEVSPRDGAIVAIRRAIACSWRAWHEVPGKRVIQKSRPAGYGLIRAGVLASPLY